MMMQHIQAQTYHARRGSLKNSFRYGVDYVLTDLRDDGPRLMSRNRWNLWSIWDHKHGGPRGAGHGLEWFANVLSERGFATDGADLLLLTQPSFLGLHFNPVSFWIATRDGLPCAIVAEVNNTFGHRHCYFCALPEFAPMTQSAQITAEKLMHVSPFQTVDGEYRFVFDVTQEAVNIRISYENGDQGVLATLTGRRQTATNRSLIWAAIRRPFGAARVVTLIYWQALKLYLKRAPFRKKPSPPEMLISDSIPNSISAGDISND